MAVTWVDEGITVNAANLTLMGADIVAKQVTAEKGCRERVRAPGRADEGAARATCRPSAGWTTSAPGGRGTAYKKGDVVRYGGNDYMAVNDSTGVTPPAPSTALSILPPRLGQHGCVESHRRQCGRGVGLVLHRFVEHPDACLRVSPGGYRRDATYIVQFAHELYTNASFVRRRTSGGWGAWVSASAGRDIAFYTSAVDIPNATRTTTGNGDLIFNFPEASYAATRHYFEFWAIVLSGGGSDPYFLRLHDGTAPGAPVQETTEKTPTGNYHATFIRVAFTPTAGLHTYQVRWRAGSRERSHPSLRGR